MVRDCQDGLTDGDGVLTQGELAHYIQRLERERDQLVATASSTRTVDIRLRDSHAMLMDMQAAGVDGLSYLPDEIAALGLRPELNARVVEMLMKDDDTRIGTITQGILDHARGRYMNIEARSMIELNSRQRALDDLREIARALELL
ncbi:MAG: hypothetical protein KC933_34875 [Myxococcales bacterium]|nr:hypothetical protein [Myxococcales bacterium]